MTEILPSAGDVVYAVDLDAEAAIEGPFDTWLRDHVADVMQFPGFLSAEILVDPAPPAGRVRRTVQYRLRDQASLDDYLANHAPRLRESGDRLFGDRYTASRRVLSHREEFIRGKVSTENCLNCGEVLTGQHCSHCGQRARVRVLSLWGLTRDLLDDVLDWDARIWRTLRPLAFQPGRLTIDYLRGKRASYTPPFRMYLLLSVAFFVVATFGSDPGSVVHFNVDKDGGTNFQIGPGESPPADGAAGGAAKTAQGTQDGGTPATGAVAKAPAAAAKPAPVRLDAETEKLVDAIVKRVPEKDRAQARRELETKLATMPPEKLGAVKSVLEDPCTSDQLHVELGPWTQDYAPRLRQACSKVWADTPSYGRALVQNVPKMMFIFLPLIAAVMFVLYLGSGRYFVEHLLFVVHYHAFFFLAGLVILLVQHSAWLAPGSAYAKGALVVGGSMTFALALYAPAYLYVAMRRVYGQGRVVTFLKFGALGIAYLFCLVITALGLIAYTALTL
ncbi:MAG: DUF4286 family protein [Steroidobacteraceae bacterium]